MSDFNKGDLVKYVGPNDEWRRTPVTGVVDRCSGGGVFFRLLVNVEDYVVGQIVHTLDTRLELLARANETTLAKAEALRYGLKQKAPVPKKPAPELWWQKKDREERELRSRNAALHLEVRKITGME